MNIYLLTQSENSDYDTYDSMIVTAKNEADAKAIHPDGNSTIWTGKSPYWHDYPDTWASTPSNVTATLIGIGNHEPGLIILSSFNAG